MTELKWDAQAFKEMKFRHRFGSDIVQQFVSSHSSIDILRELAQNSYDARARTLDVSFGRDSVVIMDDGEGFTERGWQRLEVDLSTGYAGNGLSIEGKTNSLGSKNFGLRTLFLIGNTIHVRSRGRQTMLRLLEGEPETQLADPGTKNRKGALIRTEYRSKREGSLLSFSQEQELELLTKVIEDMGPALIKLGGVGSEKGLRTVIVGSKRCNTELRWHQATRSLASSDSELTVVERRARLCTVNEEGKDYRSMLELEFRRALRLPTGYRKADFVKKNIPGYFRPRDGWIFVAVSVPIKRGRIDRNRIGRLFYPISVPESYTGCCIDVCAPFTLDANRKNIVQPAPDSWNLWLLDRAAELIVSLIKGDWLSLFGAEGYLAAMHRNGSPDSLFAGLLDCRWSRTLTHLPAI